MSKYNRDPRDMTTKPLVIIVIVLVLVFIGLAGRIINQGIEASKITPEHDFAAELFELQNDPELKGIGLDLIQFKPNSTTIQLNLGVEPQDHCLEPLDN